MDFATKNVGQVREASRHRLRRIPILGEVDGPRPQVGFNTEHWSGRVDALLRPSRMIWPERVLAAIRSEFSMSAYDIISRGGVAGGASGVYGLSVRDQWDTTQNAVDFLTDAFSLQLHTSSFTEQFDLDTADADLDAEVAAGGGYSTGGQALAGETVTVASGAVNFDADDEVWTPTTTITARYAAVICDLPDVVICALDFGADASSVAGDYTVQFGSAPAAFWSHDTTP